MDDFKSQMALHWFWLEEMPLAELPSPEAQEIVLSYRYGKRDSEEAIEALKEVCGDEVSDWIQTNLELSTIFTLEEDEEEWIFQNLWSL